MLPPNDEPGDPRGPADPRTIRADRGDGRQRLDRVLARHLADLPALSRSEIQRWIADGRVRVGDATVRRASHKVAVGDRLVVDLPPPSPSSPSSPSFPSRPSALPEDLDLEILFEDDRLLAVAKPPGLLVHPTPGRTDGTLLSGLLHLAALGAPAGDGWTPRLFHRLDRDTSGVLLVTKDREIHTALAREQRLGRIAKRYLSVVWWRVESAQGLPEPLQGRIDRPIGRDPETPDDPRRRAVDGVDARDAVTRYRILATSDHGSGSLALIETELETGRNHQIRVHLASRGWPLVGDPLYGEPRWKGLDDPALVTLCRHLEERGRQALHAWRLGFDHPATGERLEIEAPLPADLAELVTAAGLGGAHLAASFDDR